MSVVLVVVAVGAVVVAAGSVVLMRGGMARTRRRTANAATDAQRRLRDGDSIDAVAQALATKSKLPPLAAVRALADASDLSPAEALSAVRPWLSASQNDVLDRMPTERFERAMRDLSVN